MRWHRWGLAVGWLLAACGSESGRVAEPDGGYAGISARRPTGSAAIAAEGLVAAYDMETLTAAGQLRDFGPGGHHGEIAGTAAVAGLFGGARSFATVADRIDLPEAADFAIDGPLAVAAWVRVHTLGLHQHVIACDDKFALWITGRDHYRFVDTRGNGYETADGLIEADRWYSVVGVFQGGKGDVLTADNIAIYVDGVLAPGSFASVWSPGVLHPSDACYIGFESHQGDLGHQRLQFEGAVDECLVFNRALSVDEIRAHASR